MRQILVLEDEVLVAMQLETELRRAGFGVIGPFFKIRDAQRALACQVPDLAILDIRLNGEESVCVAAALLAARVPFVTLTGYSEQQIPSVYSSSRILIKPYDVTELLQALDGLDRPTIGYTL